MARKITVKVKLHSAKEEVHALGNNEFSVSVHVAPKEGEANARIIELLAEYFGVTKSCVEIHSGYASKRKIIEILA